jgi:hypothetical protein
MVRTILVVVAVLLLSSPALYAQTDSSIAVGAALTLYDPANPDAHHPTGVGVVGRLRRGSGLGVTVGLDWFTSDLQTDVGGALTPVGTMRIRPIMAGVSYIRQYRRYAISGGLVAGWAINSLQQTDAERAAYRSHVGIPDASVSISNCLAVRPDVTLWYELGHHLAASASVSYMLARPTLTAAGATGRRVDSVNLNATVITFAVAYGVF